MHIWNYFFSKDRSSEQKNVFLIVGLGNMGAEYDFTRHNVGFDVIDFIAKQEKLSFSHERYGDVSTFMLDKTKVYLLKPSTFMNLSGKAVKYWMQKLKLNMNQMLVVTDDLNIPFGQVRIRPGGSDGGHNGLKNITLELSSPPVCSDAHRDWLKIWQR